MRIALTVLATSLQLVYTSSLLIDWSANVVPNSVAYVVNYSPAVGIPPGGTTFDSSTLRALINETVPACTYTVYISAEMLDGSRKFVTRKLFYSSPLPPKLNKIETGENEATISLFPPKEANISYRIEYFPEDYPEHVSVIDTNATLLRLHGLESNTTFRIAIRSVYNNVQSTKAMRSSFKTTGKLVSPEHGFLKEAEMFSVRTFPPGFGLLTTNTNTATTTFQSIYDFSTEPTDQHPLRNSFSRMVSNSAEQSQTTLRSSSEARMLTDAEMGTSTVISSPDWKASPYSMSMRSSTAPLVLSTSKIHPELIDDTVEIIEETVPTEKPTAEEIEVGDGIEANPVIPLEQMIAEFGEPSWINMTTADNNMIRLTWSVPDGSLCDAYFVNYTVLSLTHPKSYSIATGDEFTLIKFFASHTLDLRVFCMLAGSLSKTWWAYRIASLTNPLSINALRLVSSETDEFYISRLSIDWDWPTANNFDLYRIVVSYGIVKGPSTELEVNRVGPVVLDKLEPAQQYRIAVRNESIELSLTSKVAELETITPPLISSTLYPGRISSTAINMNFGESDLQQGRFDYYELVFNARNSNITKRIEIQQEKSLTFTKLVPGKTYNFTLFTVYKGIRSRAVTEAVTTYPLKVNALHPVVGYDYVVLYWDVDNHVGSDCRFRLSYNADKIPAVSVDLKGVSRHRFNGLLPNVYYTFTITVIMGVGKAAAESESEMITVYIPRGRLTPSLIRQGSRELILSFMNDNQVFSSLNGALDNIAVIVSDDISLNDDYYELRSWFDVREEETWGSYRASPSDWQPFTKGSSSATFIIGADDCRRRSLDQPYCNGILRAKVAYKVKLRAYMNTKVAMESDWISIDGTGAESFETEEKFERRLPCYMYLNGCPRKSTIMYELLTLFSSMIFVMLIS